MAETPDAKNILDSKYSINFGNKNKYQLTVSSDISIENLSKRLGLSKNELILMNPELSNNVLKGTKINLDLYDWQKRLLEKSINDRLTQNEQRTKALKEYINTYGNILKEEAFKNSDRDNMRDFEVGVDLNKRYALIINDTDAREDKNALEHLQWLNNQSTQVALENFDNHLKRNRILASQVKQNGQTDLEYEKLVMSQLGITNEQELNLIREYLLNPNSEEALLFNKALSGNLISENPLDNERYRKINDLAKKYKQEIGGTDKILQLQFSGNVRNTINTTGKYALQGSAAVGLAMASPLLLSNPIGSWVASQVPWMAGDYVVNKGLDYIGKDDPDSWANNRYIRAAGSALGMLGGNWVGTGIKGAANYGLKEGAGIASRLFGSSMLQTTGAMMAPTAVNHGLDLIGKDDENSWANNPYLRSFANIGAMVIGHAAANKLQGIGRSKIVDYNNLLIDKLKVATDLNEINKLSLGIEKIDGLLNDNKQTFLTGLAGQDLRSGTSIKNDLLGLALYVGNKTHIKLPESLSISNITKPIFENNTAGSFANGVFFGAAHNLPVQAIDLGATYLDNNYNTGIKENSLYMPAIATLSGKFLNKGFNTVLKWKERAGGTSNGMLFALGVAQNAISPSDKPQYYSGSVPVKVLPDKYYVPNILIMAERAAQRFPGFDLNEASNPFARKRYALQRVAAENGYLATTRDELRSSIAQKIPDKKAAKAEFDRIIGLHQKMSDEIVSKYANQSGYSPFITEVVNEYKAKLPEATTKEEKLLQREQIKQYKEELISRINEEKRPLEEQSIIDFEKLSPEEKLRFILKKSPAGFKDHESNPDKVGGLVQMEGDRNYTAPFYDKNSRGFSQGQTVLIKDLNDTQSILRALAARQVRRAGNGAYYDQVTPELSTKAKFNEDSKAYSEDGKLVSMFTKLPSGEYILNPEIKSSGNRKAEWALGRSGNHVYQTNVGGYNRILALDNDGRFIELATDTPGYGNTSGTYKNPGLGLIIGGIGGKLLDWNSWKPASTNAREIKEGDKYYNTSSIVYRTVPLSFDVAIEKPIRENPILTGIRLSLFGTVSDFINGTKFEDIHPIDKFNEARLAQKESIKESKTKGSSHYWHPFKEAIETAANSSLDSNKLNNVFINFNESISSKNKASILEKVTGLKTDSFGEETFSWGELLKYQKNGSFDFPKGVNIKDVKKTISILELRQLDAKHLKYLDMLKLYVLSHKQGGYFNLKRIVYNR